MSIKIWHSFSSDMFYYMSSARDYIFKRHARNKSVYEDFIQIHMKMNKLEEREAGADSPEIHPSKDDVKEFLESEASIIQQ